MRAKLTVSLWGDTNRSPGETVEGDEAVRLCAAGFAIPIVEIEQRETAVANTTTEKRTKVKKPSVSETV